MSTSTSVHTELLAEPLPAEPLKIAAAWLAQASAEQNQPNPNAMVLATATPAGVPSARVVLCKGIVAPPGYLRFYTNYLSRKGHELAENPRAAVVMHWDHTHRQVRVEGHIVLAPQADSDAYFASRALASRVGAWASQQSQPVGSRQKLLDGVAAAAKRFGVEAGSDGLDDLAGSGETGPATNEPVVPRPPHWGGYRLWADAVELWVEGDHRIHDRARWTRTLTPKGTGDFDYGPWSATRLQP
ncbi:MAG: pyridoxal 5'-phosphate synthase [Gammaproteobacteria bacterium]